MADVSQTSDGEVLHRLLALNERGSAAVQQMLAVLQESNVEITSLRQRTRDLERQLHERVALDPLTGLLNGRGFEMQLAREEARARRFDTSVAVVCFVVENVKSIAGRYGAAAGETIQRRVGEVLRDTGRGSDVIARERDGEYVALLLGASFAGARTYIERVRAAVPAVQLPGNVAVAVRCNAGVATRDEAGSLTAALDMARHRLELERDQDPA